MTLSDIDWLDVLGWVGFATNLWGNLLLTKKTGKKGWLIRLGSNAAWVTYSVHCSTWALLANHVTFAGVNLLGWYRWTKEENQDAVDPGCPQVTNGAQPHGERLRGDSHTGSPQATDSLPQTK